MFGGLQKVHATQFQEPFRIMHSVLQRQPFGAFSIVENVNSYPTGSGAQKSCASLENVTVTVCDTSDIKLFSNCFTRKIRETIRIVCQWGSFDGL